jgi:hypothetical protein
LPVSRACEPPIAWCDQKEKVATWGSDDCDKAQDVLRVPMMAGTTNPFPVEPFTIGFVDTS